MKLVRVKLALAMCMVVGAQAAHAEISRYSFTGTITSVNALPYSVGQSVGGVLVYDSTPVDATGSAQFPTFANRLSWETFTVGSDSYTGRGALNSALQLIDGVQGGDFFSLFAQINGTKGDFIANGVTLNYGSPITSLSQPASLPTFVAPNTVANGGVSFTSLAGPASLNFRVDSLAPVAAVPEPGSLALMMAGGLYVLFATRRRMTV